MSKNVTIRINTENDAFVGYESSEVARILREIADSLDSATMTIGTLDEKFLFDINGNKVGSIKVK